jgi:hypothetical protein
MLDLPGSGAHLEFTATEHTPPPAPHAEALLVLYLGNQSTVDRVLTRLAVTPVPSANPYWDRVGVTVVDPDGFRVVLVSQYGSDQRDLDYLIRLAGSSRRKQELHAEGKKQSRPLKTKKTKSMCQVVRHSSPLRFPHAAGYR